MTLPQRTISEHVAHLESVADLAVGERVIVTGSGRTGTVVAPAIRHNGPKIKWDEPVFGCTEGRVMLSLLDRLTEGGD